MALTKCPECRKDISTYAASCPYCGFPRGSTAREPLPQVVPPLPPNHPTPPPPRPATGSKTDNDKIKKGCLGCAGVLAIVAFIGLMAGLFGGDEKKEPSGADASKSGQGSERTHSVFESGGIFGVVDGTGAYDGGAIHATDEQLDAAGRLISANIQFDKPGDRQDWIAGYKAGYEIGWKHQANKK